MPDRNRAKGAKSGARRASVTQEDSTAGHREGDKIRIKTGAHVGARGLVSKVTRDLLVVVFDGAGHYMLQPNAVTNYSLAARKAWAVMPKRSGRPPSTHPAKRMVSLRLDIELLSRLDEAVRMELVENRSHGITRLVNEGLDSLGVAGKSESSRRVMKARGRFNG